MIFKTTATQASSALEIALEMESDGLPKPFIAHVLELAQSDQGVFELMELWSESRVQEERDKLIADLQEILEIRLGGAPL